MKVEPTDDPEIGRIVLPETLTKDNRQEFKNVVLDDLESKRRSIIVDGIDCRYIDSTGLGVLITVSKKVREQGRGLALANLTDDIQMLFELTKLDTMFYISDTVNSATLRLTEPALLRELATEPKARKAYEPNDLLDFQEVVDWFGVAPRTVERMNLSWSFPTKGRLRRILFKDLLAHVERRKIG